jgi:hypothetical protein
VIGGDGPIVRSEPYVLDASEYPFSMAMYVEADPTRIVWAVTALAPPGRLLALLKIPPGRVWVGETVDVTVMNPEDWPEEWEQF